MLEAEGWGGVWREGEGEKSFKKIGIAIIFIIAGPDRDMTWKPVEKIKNKSLENYQDVLTRDIIITRDYRPLSAQKNVLELLLYYCCS